MKAWIVLNKRTKRQPKRWIHWEDGDSIFGTKERAEEGLTDSDKKIYKAFPCELIIKEER